MKRFFYIGWLLFFLFSGQVSGQTLISGVVKNKRDSLPVADAYVSLQNLKDNHNVGFAITKKDGQFGFANRLGPGVYRMKIHHQQYDVWQTDIIIDSSAREQLFVSAYLNEKVNQLDEVVINIQKPIVVKKDTVIYDISAFKNENDETLEDVLRRLKGFEITESGEIKVNNKLIKKVLVNGKEISDTGGALITKSIDPDKVDKIEVRFKEQDQKIKESILSRSDYAVLDIKLKKDLKNPFFGKLRFKQAYQERYLPGGYANVFYLKRKTKIHFFGEYDVLGQKIISLQSIRNIGREAMAKLFERPSDYDDIVHRQGFLDEIYGFKDYTLNRSGIIGFTGAFELNPKWRAFVGSFNEYDHKASAYFSRQWMITGDHLAYDLLSPHKSFASKNKIEVRFDQPGTKISYDLNFVYENNQTDQFLNYQSDKYIHLSKKSDRKSVYQNLLVEKKLGHRWGVDFKANQSCSEVPENLEFLHNFDNLASLSFNQGATVSHNVIQTENLVFNDYFASPGVYFFGDNFQLTYRLLYQNRRFTYQLLAKDKNTGKSLDDFGQEVTILKYADLQNKILLSADYRKFHGDAGITAAYIIEQPDVYARDKNYYFSYKFGISYEAGFNFSSRISYDNHYTNYSFLKQIITQRILDYNTLYAPAPHLPLTREQLLEMSLSYRTFVDIQLAFLAGKSTNKYEYLPTPGWFVARSPGVSETSFQMFSSIFQKKIRKLKVILEPEYISHTSFNRYPALHKIKSDIWLLGLKLFYEPPNRPLQFKLYPKFTKFVYFNAYNLSRHVQDMLSLKNSISYRFVKKYFTAGAAFRYVAFRGISQAEFYNLNLFFKGKIRKNLSWKFEALNITDNKDFYTQIDNPLFLLINRHQVFGRSFQFSLNYVF